MTELLKSFEGDVVSRYVIQINLMFKPKAVNHLGAFNVWKKGGWFGRADELMSFCPKGGCVGVMPEKHPVTEAEYELVAKNMNNPSKWPKHIIKAMSHYYQTSVMCPVCNSMAIRETLPDSYGFNMTPDKIAERASQLFDHLGRDADILLIRSKETAQFQKAKNYLQSANMRVSEYAKQLEEARDQDMVYYSLKKIIKDTTSGSTVASRIKSLIEA